MTKQATATFTFQYGSTFINSCLINLLYHNKFTFQYGSTFIKQYGLQHLQPFQDLHSNMVLLLSNPQPLPLLFLKEFTFQYGSTFIILSFLSLFISSTFTFQYGSTFIIFNYF